jgi:biotin carboxyl carrier protein
MTSHAKHTLTLTIDGKRFQVEIEDLGGSPLKVWVNGEPHHVAVERTASRSRDMGAPAQAIEMSAPVPMPPPTKSATAMSGDITSPMPGNILDIMVEPGDVVEVGQQICSLEAMKMKSAIRSGREGVVATVEVTPGQAVAYGDVILTFE